MFCNRQSKTVVNFTSSSGLRRCMGGQIITTCKIVKVVRKGTAQLLMCYSQVQIGTHLCHSVRNVNQIYLSHKYTIYTQLLWCDS
jgi:hypothetical protein